MLFFAAPLLLVVSSALVVYLIISRSQRARPGPPRCGNCRYDLTGSVSNRCPECGKLFIEAGVLLNHPARVRRLAGLALAFSLLPIAAILVAYTVALHQQQRAAAAAIQARRAAQQARALLQAQIRPIQERRAGQAPATSQPAELRDAASTRPADVQFDRRDPNHWR